MSQFFLYLCTKTKTKMKRLLLLTIMFAPLAMLAQQVVVSGTVVDDRTGAKLRQASVSAGRVSVVTNEDGVFTLKLDGNPKAVQVSHLGYGGQTSHQPHTPNFM